MPWVVRSLLASVESPYTSIGNTWAAFFGSIMLDNNTFGLFYALPDPMSSNKWQDLYYQRVAFTRDSISLIGAPQLVKSGTMVNNGSGFSADLSIDNLKTRGLITAGVHSWFSFNDDHTITYEGGTGTPSPVLIVPAYLNFFTILGFGSRPFGLLGHTERIFRAYKQDLSTGTWYVSTNSESRGLGTDGNPSYVHPLPNGKGLMVWSEASGSIILWHMQIVTVTLDGTTVNLTWGNELSGRIHEGFGSGSLGPSFPILCTLEDKLYYTDGYYQYWIEYDGDQLEVVVQRTAPTATPIFLYPPTRGSAAVLHSGLYMGTRWVSGSRRGKFQYLAGNWIWDINYLVTSTTDGFTMGARIWFTMPGQTDRFICYGYRTATPKDIRFEIHGWPERFWEDEPVPPPTEAGVPYLRNYGRDDLIRVRTSGANHPISYQKSQRSWWGNTYA